MASRIMVVDDDADVRDLVCSMLEDCGFEPVAAAGGRQALAQALGAPPDLVITDVVMPGLDGYELLQALHRLMPRLRSVVMSGGGRLPPEPYLATARRLGAGALLRKPFTKAELLGAVRAALARPETT